MREISTTPPFEDAIISLWNLKPNKVEESCALLKEGVLLFGFLHLFV